LSEEPMSGVGSVTLDCRVAPRVPSRARASRRFRSSTMRAWTTFDSRRFNARTDSIEVLPGALLAAKSARPSVALCSWTTAMMCSVRLIPGSGGADAVEVHQRGAVCGGRARRSARPVTRPASTSRRVTEGSVTRGRPPARRERPALPRPLTCASPIRSGGLVRSRGPGGTPTDDGHLHTADATVEPCRRLGPSGLPTQAWPWPHCC
jgi:hypothetical protein